MHCFKIKHINVALLQSIDFCFVFSAGAMIFRYLQAWLVRDFCSSPCKSAVILNIRNTITDFMRFGLHIWLHNPWIIVTVSLNLSWSYVTSWCYKRLIMTSNLLYITFESWTKLKFGTRLSLDCTCMHTHTHKHTHTHTIANVLESVWLL